MNTSKLTYAIATLSLVLFMSIASIANSSIFYSVDLLKSGDKNISTSNTIETDFSYLRFDVNKFINESEVIEMPSTEFDYLRFDVNNFTENHTDNAIELPVIEYGFLRFDVNNFTQSNTENTIELPVNEFDYLRFDVNNFTLTGNNVIDELPINE